MKTLREIELRMAQIADEAKGDDADLDALETELTGLREERATLQRQERRNALLGHIAEGDIESRSIKNRFDDDDRPTVPEEELRASTEYRTAWAKHMMGRRMEAAERNVFREVNKRALGAALTTTDTEFIAPTEEADGINNGGIFIPSSIHMEILKMVELASPFFRDIRKIQVLGTVKYPYEESSTGAEWYEEPKQSPKPTKDQSTEFKELLLTGHELAKLVRMTWKLEAMAIDSFLSYVTEELGVKMREALATAALYGDGVNKMTGATVGAIQTVVAASPTASDFKAGFNALPLRKRIGAKLYVSDQLYNEVIFEKGTNGYFLPVINASGLNSVGKVSVEVDPFLKDMDYIYGNARNYLFNTHEGIMVERERDVRNRWTLYAGWGVFDGKPVPKAFVYGKQE